MSTTNETYKPSWEDAPPWANYLARDADGRWYWYEIKPFADIFSRWLPTSGMSELAYKPPEYDTWHKSLEQRPVEEE